MITIGVSTLYLVLLEIISSQTLEIVLILTKRWLKLLEIWVLSIVWILLKTITLLKSELKPCRLLILICTTLERRFCLTKTRLKHLFVSHQRVLKLIGCVALLKTKIIILFKKTIVLLGTYSHEWSQGSLLVILSINSFVFLIILKSKWKIVSARKTIFKTLFIRLIWLLIWLLSETELIRIIILITKSLATERNRLVRPIEVVVSGCLFISLLLSLLLFQNLSISLFRLNQWTLVGYILTTLRRTV